MSGSVFCLTQRKEREGRAPSRPSGGCRAGGSRVLTRRMGTDVTTSVYSLTQRRGGRRACNALSRSTRSTRLILSFWEGGLCPVRLSPHAEERAVGSRPVATEWRLSGVACRAGGRVSPRAAWERTRQPPSIISRRGAEDAERTTPYTFYTLYTANPFVSFRTRRRASYGISTLTLKKRCRELVGPQSAPSVRSSFPRTV